MHEDTARAEALAEVLVPTRKQNKLMQHQRPDTLQMDIRLTVYVVFGDKEPLSDKLLETLQGLLAEL